MFTWILVSKNLHPHEQLQQKFRQKLGKLEKYLQSFPPDTVHLQIKLEKRFSKGLALLAHYTWAKMIDDASVTSGNLTWLGGTTSFQNPLDYKLERALSQNDVPHRFVATADWQVPFGHGRAFGANVNRVVDGTVRGSRVRTPARARTTGARALRRTLRRRARAPFVLRLHFAIGICSSVTLADGSSSFHSR